MHRQRSLSARVPGARARSIAARLERRGVAATYALHDRVLANPGARRRFGSAAAPVDELQRDLLDRLHENGFAVVPFADLVADAGLTAAVEEQGASFIAQTESALAGDPVGGAAEAARQGVRDPGPQLRRRPAWVSTTPGSGPASPRGCSTSPTPTCGCGRSFRTSTSGTRCLRREGSERAASQLWHLDFDDKHLLKAFLYLNDVDAFGGPLRIRAGQPAARPVRLDLALVADAHRPDPRRTGAVTRFRRTGSRRSRRRAGR